MHFSSRSPSKPNYYCCMCAMWKFMCVYCFFSLFPHMHIAHATNIIIYLSILNWLIIIITFFLFWVGHLLAQFAGVLFVRFDSIQLNTYFPIGIIYLRMGCFYFCTSIHLSLWFPICHTHYYSIRKLICLISLLPIILCWFYRFHPLVLISFVRNPSNIHRQTDMWLFFFLSSTLLLPFCGTIPTQNYAHTRTHTHHINKINNSYKRYETHSYLRAI